MTLEEIELLPKEVLTCQDVAPVLGAAYYNIHQQAMKDPAKLGFPVVIHGSRVKIPKRAFIKFMRGEA